MQPINANAVIRTHNVLFVTFDSLRYDVARAAMYAGCTPNLATIVPGGRWEERRTQGSFTYPAHQAFFAGFLPVPSGPGRPGRLLACRAIRGTTITERTFVFDAPDIVTGFAELGYRTVCVGGVGFFSKATKLGSVLPDLFQESYWAPRMGASSPASTQHQVDTALGVVREQQPGQRLFLFMNVTATHVPHHMHLGDGTADSWESQWEALSYADKEMGRLFASLPDVGPWLVVMCADHGEAFGEDGYEGHGVAHPAVWTVPYAETVIPAAVALSA
ncbi:STM4013/SEN3800 family hydrolase [Streptomyces sp. NPDC093261]|uniref:STM4013/SEN3800 family hydrolase n=1 Tax=Streptomyces sp. NPDC093261 TaxID=3366037 RepID=UPI003808D817